MFKNQPFVTVLRSNNTGELHNGKQPGRPQKTSVVDNKNPSNGELAPSTLPIIIAFIFISDKKLRKPQNMKLDIQLYTNIQLYTKIYNAELA